MTNGTFVAAYELTGVHSYYHTEEMRNSEKESLEAVLRSLPERSMRLHVRFEIRQDTGNVIGQYADCARSTNVVLGAIDQERCSRWLEKEGAGEFFDYRLHAMFYWDSVIHKSEPGHEWEHKLRRHWSLSAGKAIQRARSEHESLTSEFTSLLAGIETTLASTGLHVQRLHDDELFLLVRKTINPLDSTSAPYRRNGPLGSNESIRNRLTSVSIESETDEYLKVGGLLYTFVSLKEPPIASPGQLLPGPIFQGCCPTQDFRPPVLPHPPPLENS